MQTQTLNRAEAVQIVLASLREVLAMNGEPIPERLGEDVVFVGNDAILDSLGVVSLIVEVEQRLEQEHDILVTLANDKAMSQRNSPFRTAGVLAEYVCTLVQEGSAL